MMTSGEWPAGTQDDGTETTPDLVLVRSFEEPRSRVFRAWVDPVLLARWWGPQGFTNPVCEIDPRPGGAIRIVMKNDDGQTFPMSGTVHEAVEPERLVFTSRAFEGPDGEPGIEVRNHVTFHERDGQTVVELLAIVLRSKPQYDASLEGMEIGWAQSLERLREAIPPVGAGQDSPGKAY